MPRKSRYTKTSEQKQTARRQFACVYLRVSVEDGDCEESNSIANQRKVCLDYLKKQNDLELGQIFVDDGYTGMNYNRPGFRQMMELLEREPGGCIIVKDISRLGRSYIFTSEYVERTFPAMGVRLICINDQYDSDTKEADRNALLMPFKLIINDSYVKDISKKIRSSIRAQMNCGEYVPSSGSIPYGYLRDPERHSFAVDHETACVVQKIFTMRADGQSFNAIAKSLNSDEVPSPSRIRYIRGMLKSEKFSDTLWTRGTIRKITNDISYLGCRIHGKVSRSRLGGEKRKQSREHWQVIPDIHPAIITKEEFDRVQAVNTAAAEKRAGYRECDAPELDYRSLFAGKVFCMDCGSGMRSIKQISRTSSPKNNTFGYNCGRYIDSEHLRCSNHWIRQDVLMEAVQKTISSQIELFGLTEDARELTKKGMNEAMEAVQMDISRISADYNKAKAKSERLFEDYASELLDRDTYLLLKQKYSDELAVLAAKRVHLEQKAEMEQKRIRNAVQKADLVKRYQSQPEIDRKLMQALIDRIFVSGDRRVHIRLTFCNPFENISGTGGGRNAG